MDEQESSSLGSQEVVVSETDRLKKECSAMLKLLKKLDTQERDLRLQNEILAREALSNGFQVGLLEPPAPKKRYTRKPSMKKTETAP